jgi:zinc protease
VTADPLVLERERLEDGLVLARQVPPAGSSAFAASVVIPAGWGYDPPGLEGLALLVARLVTSGAGRLGRIALARELDRFGATLTAQTAPESTEVTLWGPVDQWEALLPLLADAVLRPRFDPADLERARRQLLERQLREASQPESRAEKELWESVYAPGHPYRATGFGTPRSVRRVRRSDLVRFHRSHFVSEGALLVLTVREPIDRLGSRARRWFSGWRETRAPARPSFPPPRRSNGEARRVPLPGRSQVEIRIGGPSVARGDARFPAVALANELLGGRPLLSRLFQRVRERHGLAYHASSDLEAMRWGGYWLAEAGTGPKSADRVARLLRAEVERLSQGPIGITELDRIRESAIGSIPLALETAIGAHELALDVAYHDLPLDFYRRWPATLRALRASDLREAAAAGFDPGRAVTVLAGPLEGSAG